VLASVVAADGRHDRVGRLATDHKAIVLANARPRPVQIELEKIQAQLTNVRLASDHRHGAGARIREGRRRPGIPEVGPIESDRVAAARLNCWFVCCRTVMVAIEWLACNKWASGVILCLVAKNRALCAPLYSLPLLYSLEQHTPTAIPSPGPPNSGP
jgi:hypothetical protein